MKPKLNCPIPDDTEQVIASSWQLTRAVRKLRRDLNACLFCRQAKSCPILRDLRSQIQEAIEVVNEELRLA
jgi:hypothetical protein